MDLIHVHLLGKVLLLIFPLHISLSLTALPSAFKSVHVSLVLKKASSDYPIALQPLFPSQTSFSSLHFVFLTSHSLLIPLIYYTEPLEAASIIDSTPTISPNLLNQVPSDLYIYLYKGHILMFNLFKISVASSKVQHFLWLSLLHNPRFPPTSLAISSWCSLSEWFSQECATQRSGMIWAIF